MEKKFKQSEWEHVRAKLSFYPNESRCYLWWSVDVYLTVQTLRNDRYYIPVCPVLHFQSEKSHTHRCLNEAWLLSYRVKNLQFHGGTLKQFPLIQTTLWSSGLIVLILSSFLICFMTLLCSAQSRHSPVAKIPVWCGCPLVLFCVLPI